MVERLIEQISGPVRTLRLNHTHKRRRDRVRLLLLLLLLLGLSHARPLLLRRLRLATDPDGRSTVGIAKAGRGGGEHVGTVGLLGWSEHVAVGGGEAVTVLGGKLGDGDAEVVLVFGRVFELGWVVLPRHFLLGLVLYRFGYRFGVWGIGLGLGLGLGLGSGIIQLCLACLFTRSFVLFGLVHDFVRA